jgi:uncharacterized membrane protein
MTDQTGTFIGTGIILIVALLATLFLLLLVIVFVDRITSRTIVKCPLSKCMYCKNGLCKQKDIALKLIIGDDDREGLFCDMIKFGKRKSIDVSG